MEMPQETRNIEKFDIKVKPKPKDGLIIQLHHTVRKSNGENKRIRFSTGSFDDAHEKLACADNVGNIFILDFIDLKFWKVTNQCPCTALQFIPGKSDSIIIARDTKFSINYIDIETGATSLTLLGHTAPIKHISFSNNKIKNLLTASAVEAILWELKNHTKYFTLTTYSNAQIQQIMFAPASDYLVACFQNDTVQIWRHETMKSIKQIIPNELKHMKSIAFSMNGRAMAMAGLTPLLILFSLDTWKALKSVDLLKFNISGVQQIAFIPQMFDGGSNKILGVLSSDCILHFLDLETLCILHRIHPESSGIRKFEVSPTGKYFLCVLQLGEVNIYNTSCVLDIAHNNSKEISRNPVTCSTTQKIIKDSHCEITDEVKDKKTMCMDSARLRRILIQHGEYPEKYRCEIWKCLLATPRNKVAYSALLDKGIHPAYKDIEKNFTIHSTITLKSLKRLLSCLAHWCPLFGVMKFLPGFVFPFVKVLHKDPLLLFESVATILINQCQLWFEYAPFPPISILAMIENILAEFDHKLVDHFSEHGITSQTYALTILETAFSEILTCSEWLILWDHILSNEPAFMLMAVVSYNIVQRNTLRRLSSCDHIEHFYHMQNPIDKRTFLKKIYVLLNDTPEDIHPRQFFNTFVTLEKGNTYQQFNGYPKATICLKLAKKERRKFNKSEDYTLKELTTKSQEKQILGRLQQNYKSDKNPEPITHSNHCKKKQKKKKSDSNCNGGDVIQKDIKDDLIKSIMYPKVYNKPIINNMEIASQNSKEADKKCINMKVKEKRNVMKEKEKKSSSSTDSDVTVQMSN